MEVGDFCKIDPKRDYFYQQIFIEDNNKSYEIVGFFNYGSKEYVIIYGSISSGSHNGTWWNLTPVVDHLGNKIEIINRREFKFHFILKEHLIVIKGSIKISNSKLNYIIGNGFKNK
jgi:hypothetical protein